MVHWVTKIWFLTHAFEWEETSCQEKQENSKCPHIWWPCKIAFFLDNLWAYIWWSSAVIEENSLLVTFAIFSLNLFLVFFSFYPSWLLISNNLTTKAKINNFYCNLLFRLISNQYVFKFNISMSNSMIMQIAKGFYYFSCNCASHWFLQTRLLTKASRIVLTWYMTITLISFSLFIRHLFFHEIQ